ncbi:hypothetical protein L9F63_002111, partial [Diploptera punctata]
AYRHWLISKLIISYKFPHFWYQSRLCFRSSKVQTPPVLSFLFISVALTLRSAVSWAGNPSISRADCPHAKEYSYFTLPSPLPRLPGLTVIQPYFLTEEVFLWMNKVGLSKKNMP